MREHQNDEGDYGMLVHKNTVDCWQQRYKVDTRLLMILYFMLSLYSCLFHWNQYVKHSVPVQLQISVHWSKALTSKPFQGGLPAFLQLHLTSSIHTLVSCSEQLDRKIDLTYWNDWTFKGANIFLKSRLIKSMILDVKIVFYFFHHFMCKNRYRHSLVWHMCSWSWYIAEFEVQ